MAILACTSYTGITNFGRGRCSVRASQGTFREQALSLVIGVGGLYAERRSRIVFVEKKANVIIAASSGIDSVGASKG